MGSVPPQHVSFYRAFFHLCINSCRRQPPRHEHSTTGRLGGASPSRGVGGLEMQPTALSRDVSPFKTTPKKRHLLTLKKTSGDCTHPSFQGQRTYIPGTTVVCGNICSRERLTCSLDTHVWGVRHTQTDRDHRSSPWITHRFFFFFFL